MSGRLGSSGSRDLWEILDITGKLLSGVALAFVGLMVKCGSDKIAQSQAEADLGSKLIADMADTGQVTKIRTDLALLALDHAVDPKDTSFVPAVCARILAGKPISSAEQNVAWVILARRNPQMAERLRDDPAIQRNVAIAAAEGQMLATSSPTAQMSGKTPDGPNPTQLIRAVLGSVVYVQFRDETQRDSMRGLQRSLQSAGFNAPGVDSVTSDFASDVRYFSINDRPLADSVARLTASYFHKRPIPVRYYAYAVPPGQIEVWINLKNW